MHTIVDSLGCVEGEAPETIHPKSKGLQMTINEVMEPHMKRKKKMGSHRNGKVTDEHYIALLEFV